MNLLSLNDDILLSIFAQLYGEDALNVSLTSKHVFALAGPRIASDITCTSPEELRRLHAYLLSSIRGTLWAKFVEKFVIHIHTFAGDTDDDEYYANFSQAFLLGDILLQASNIRELYFDRFHPCLERDPRILHAIRSLTSLDKLDLFVVADASLSIFDTPHHLDKLSYLNLCYYCGDDPVKNQTKSLPPLVSVLPSFRHLDTLAISFFEPTARLPRAARPSLPSIRTLDLCEVSTPALDLVDLCPNLFDLTISLSSEGGERIVIEGPKWPSLRQLKVEELDEVRWFPKRLGTVDQLQICGRIRLNSETTAGGAMSPKERLLELLRDTSPVGVYMCMELSGQVEQTSGFWSDVARAAPRLRSLELQLYRPRTEDSWDDYSWVSELPNALRSLPLQCLRVLVLPEQRHRPRVPDREAEAANEARDREEEINRVKTLNALTPLVVHAFPSLRCLSVGDAAINMDLWDDIPLDPAVSALQVDEEAVEWEWDYLRHLLVIRKQRWWRVVDGPHGRELVEITSGEGEAAQREIETVTRIEDSTH
ncbi:hypothetical protein L227DRAFT_568156 [Lentinus tigrinus ALCF2SS1-6]|uniref:F-box domain-containing protein n=1 Tax=Lentinus tigrinus ALCF2SS1-6 TaxID=1328759 RepID=A0A5C2RN98_9APHY|nr:hypothetical protein L227DRAFT_568156 [Lentinus tigrinus ALCF2SS1-6]